MPSGGPVPTRPRSGRGPVLVVATLLLLAGIGALIVYLTQRGSDGFPGGAERAERAVEDIRIGDVEISAALYGTAGSPELFAALYDNYPSGVAAETIIQGAANGAEATGGNIDQESLQVSESNGYSFACMSGGGPGFLVPGGPSEQGVMCVFQGELVGVTVTTRTQEPTVGLSDVQAFVEALEAA